MRQDPELRRLVRLAGGYNRKARAYGVRGTMTGAGLMLIESLIDHCAYCGITLEPGHGTFDHVVPFDRGGTNEFHNITRCCTTCQRNKFTKLPQEYATHQSLRVQCAVCGREFQPRWAEYQAGRARVCSRSCAAKSRWSK